MPADAGLKEYEIIWIARRERQIVGFYVADGPSRTDARRIDDRRSSSDLDRCSHRAHLKLRVDNGLRAGRQRDSRMAFLIEPFLLDGHGITAERQVGKHVVAVLVGGNLAGEASVVIENRDLGLRHRRGPDICYAAANAAVDGLRLSKCGLPAQYAEKHAGQQQKK